MDISQKTVFITSGQRRLGREIALGLAAAGANVVIAHYEETDLAEETVKRIQELGRKSMRVWIDITDKASVNAAAEQAMALTGNVDILVNAASYYRKRRFPTRIPPILKGHWRCSCTGLSIWPTRWRRTC